MKKVTDPLLLMQLNGDVSVDVENLSDEDRAAIIADAQAELAKRPKKVTDPLLLEQLNKVDTQLMEKRDVGGSYWKNLQDQERRMTANMLAAPFETFIDMPLDAVSKLAGIDSRWTTPVRTSKESFLRSIGVDPVANGSSERIAQAGLNALTGAGMASGANAVRSAAVPALEFMSQYPARQMAGAITGTTAGEAAREMGMSDLVQMGASLGGGLLGSQMMGIAEGVGRGVGNAARGVLTDEGKQEIAGRALYRQTTNPDQVINRLANQDLRQEYVKGSKPITSEIAQDPGFSMGVNGFRANPIAVSEGADQINNLRAADQAEATRNLLNTVNRMPQAGEEDIINKLSRISNMAFDKYAKDKDLSQIPVDRGLYEPQIKGLIQNYEGRKSIQNMLQNVLNNATPKDSLKPTFSQVFNGESVPQTSNLKQGWNARKELDADLFKTTSSPEAAPELKGASDAAALSARRVLNDALKAADPEFEPYLRRDAFARQYKDSLTRGRQLAEKIQGGAPTAVQNEADVVGAGGVSANQANRIAGKLTDVAGNDTALAGKLTKRQREAFENIAKDRERMRGLDLGNPNQSATAAYLARGNLLTNDILDGLLGVPANGKPNWLRMTAEGLGKALEKSGITAPMEAAIYRELKAGAIDPDYALKLLQRGRDTVRGPLDLRQGAINNAESGLLGLLMSR